MTVRIRIEAADGSSFVIEPDGDARKQTKMVFKALRNWLDSKRLDAAPAHAPESRDTLGDLPWGRSQ